MQITKEYLEERLSSLKQQFEQLKSNVWAVEGAIKDTEEILAALNKEEDGPKKKG
jgi:prefoldin subunit 5